MRPDLSACRAAAHWSGCICGAVQTIRYVESLICFISSNMGLEAVVRIVVQEKEIDCQIH